MVHPLTTQHDVLDPASLVDTDRYPLDEPDAWIAEARAALAADGVAILPGFIRPEAVAAMCAEADRLAPVGHHSLVQGTPYLGLPDESFPEGHPRRALVDNSLTAIAYDQIPGDSPLRALYEWPVLTELIRRMLDRPELFHYADPFGALNIAAMSAGDELGWHFDQTDFVVSVALQSSVEGGRFESASRLRSAEDDNPDGVNAVLAGDRDGVLSVPMTPGTLMLFEGRNSLHRVTTIEGEVPRYVALLAYDTVPGTDSSELLKLVRYGRLPEPTDGSGQQ
ncbi:MAG: hypothetical protein U0Q22_06930 [Acidimicrobiales bacterium]